MLSFTYAGGSVTLATNSAFDHPNINPGFLTTSFDISASVEAVKQTQKFISFSPWKGYIQSGFGEVAQLKTDAEIEAFVRNAATTIKHPVSTASVSKVTDKTGVVGPDLKVKGVTGLRVVDGSVLVSQLSFGHLTDHPTAIFRGRLSSSSYLPHRRKSVRVD